jgi:phage baseplate assembly protein W
MSTAIDRFKNVIIGSATKDISYSDDLLPNIELDRKEGIDAIIESWRNILLTPERTADHDPEYGSRLKEFIFEPFDESTQDEIGEEVRNKLMRYDNRATIKNINIFRNRDRKGFILDITVNYKGQEKQLQQSIDESMF